MEINIDPSVSTIVKSDLTGRTRLGITRSPAACQLDPNPPGIDSNDREPGCLDATAARPLASHPSDSDLSGMP